MSSPAPIKVLFTGPVTLPFGASASRKEYRALEYDDLAQVARQRAGDRDVAIADLREPLIRAAARDGLILCVRPCNWRDEARVGLSLQEALDHAALDGLRGMIAVHPYDEDGEPITTADGEPLTKWAAK